MPMAPINIHCPLTWRSTILLVVNNRSVGPDKTLTSSLYLLHIFFMRICNNLCGHLIDNGLINPSSFKKERTMRFNWKIVSISLATVLALTVGVVWTSAAWAQDTTTESADSTGTMPMRQEVRQAG